MGGKGRLQPWGAWHTSDHVSRLAGMGSSTASLGLAPFPHHLLCPGAHQGEGGLAQGQAHGLGASPV